MPDYQFPEPYRTHVKGLAELMYYANSRDDGKWADQSASKEYDGVYGSAFTTVKYIVRELFNADFAERTMDNINYGGCASFLEDIEMAVTHARDYPND